MGMMGMGAAPLPEPGLDPAMAAMMAADPNAPEVGPVAPAPVDQMAMMQGAMPPAMPAGPDAITAAVTPELLQQAMQAAADELLQAGHMQLDQEHGMAREAASAIVGQMMGAQDPMMAQAGGIGPAIPPPMV